MRLSEIFEGYATKRLSTVEASAIASNQHEFNGVTALKDLLGTEKIDSAPAHFLRLSDDETVMSADARLTWYDARENHPTRSEYRLYFSSNPVMESAQPGDLMVVARLKRGRLLVLLAPQGSTCESQIEWLLGTATDPDGSARVFSADRVPEVRYAAREILGTLELAYPEDLISLPMGVREGVATYVQLRELQPSPTEQNSLELTPSSVSSDTAMANDHILGHLGAVFPSTAAFSKLARESMSDINPVEAPDDALVAWVEQEQMLFLHLEKKVIASRIQQGFAVSDDVDVDGFIKFSLSVQNRRKARAGYALENHIREILQVHGVDFDSPGKTENGKRPDFLFPGIDRYEDPTFPDEKLHMLGAKSTCKERWRQVLSEANRIETKHLLTFEGAISTTQIHEMEMSKLQLVIPRALQDTFHTVNRKSLLSLGDFLALVKSNSN